MINRIMLIAERDAISDINKYGFSMASNAAGGMAFGYGGPWDPTYVKVYTDVVETYRKATS